MKASTNVGLRKSTFDSSYHGLIIRILQKRKKPMSLKEITTIILKMKKSYSKSPEKTISAILQRSKHIRQVGRSMFALSEHYKNPTFSTR